MEWVGVGLLAFILLGIGGFVMWNRRSGQRGTDGDTGGWLPWMWFGGPAHGGSESGPGSDPSPGPDPSPSPDVGDFGGGDFGGGGDGGGGG